MRALTITLTLVMSAQAQNTRPDFSGTWLLNSTRSEIRTPSKIPSGVLRIAATASVMTVSLAAQEGEAWSNLIYPLGGRAERSLIGADTISVAARWADQALLASVNVSGAVDSKFSEVWVRSRDGNRLTITRTTEGPGTPVESLFAYDIRSATAPVLIERRERVQPATPQALSQAETTPVDYILPAGTRILLRLANPVNTKNSAPGDRLYLQTAMPVFLNGRIVIPPGSYVTGIVTESTRAGRVSGKSGLNFRFDTLTLPNGIARDFRSRAGSVGDRGNIDRSEGRITGDGSPGKDAAMIAKTTTAGAGIGGLTRIGGDSRGMGVGVGAAAGAAAGLAGVLATRGPDVVIPQGATMEMVLDRELRYTEAELSLRPR